MCVFEAFRDHGVLNRHTFFHLQGIHDLGDSVCTKKPEQVVLQGEEETASSHVTLTTGTTTKLIVDSARFVPLRTDNHQPASTEHLFALLAANLFVLGQRLFILFGIVRDFLLAPGFHWHILGAGFFFGESFWTSAEQDIRTATGHVSGDSHAAESTSLSHNSSLFTVLFSV